MAKKAKKPQTFAVVYRYNNEDRTYISEMNSAEHRQRLITEWAQATGINLTQAQLIEQHTW